ncbi:hypothetical protein [Mycoplasmopsis bovirhinis]|uniref:hypothetical protein n=1 Tax=Mycoplasmopsis bovirhinis TaxID=29553 RepID=UPI000E74564C|nr:hypothetical protein [Mycoplasmopsis bovirhinis]
MKYAIMFAFWFILFLIWLILSIFLFIYIKNSRNNLIGQANLFFISTEYTQKYFQRRRLKLEDWFFDAVHKIFEKYELSYRKNVITLNWLWRIHGLIMASLLFFSDVMMNFLRLLEVNETIIIITYVLIIVLLVLVSIYFYSVYFNHWIILWINLDKIDQWREENKNLPDQNYFEPNDYFLKKLNFTKKQTKRLFIYCSWFVFNSFIHEINYDQFDNDIFATKEQYHYFLSIFPYNLVLINLKSYRKINKKRNLNSKEEH